MTGATVSHDIEALCRAIKSGATLAEACRSEGVPYNTARRWLERGATSKPDTVSRVNRDLILKAQAQYLKGALAIVHKAAAKGAPRAVDEVLRRVEAMTAEAEYQEPPQDPLERARWLLELDYKQLPTATGIARNQLRTTIRQTEADITEMEEKQNSAMHRQRTPAEQEDWERRHAAELEDIHLQLYVVAYLQKHPGVHLATADGPLELFGA